jgi:hypothetical protein
MHRLPNGCREEEEEEEEGKDPPFRCELITTTAYQRSKPCEEV